MKTVKILLAIILLVLSYQTVNARIINVPDDSSTIQKGINGANIDGDTVLVDRGTYYENIHFDGKNILVASKFIEDGLQTTIDSTIINGGGVGRVVNMQSVNGPNAGITGFTITNGRADYGGGIYCHLTSARISHNVITGDTAGSGVGGGIYVGWKSSPTIDSNQILSNEAVNGGGIRFSDSSSGEIYGNIIRNNRAWPDNGGGNGGGLQICGGSYPNIHNNIIDSNTVRYYGGGIDCAGGSSPNITENDIVANDAPAGGGGIGCGSSSPLIERNTIRRNKSRDCGGGILVRRSYATIAWNVIDSNECSSYGGGVEFYEDTSSFFNNTVDGNSAGEYYAGGGIHCTASSAPRIWNNIITNSPDGWGISCFPTSNPYISHNNVWNNSRGNFYGCPPGVGENDTINCNHDSCDSFFNISEDPLFDPDSTNYFLLCSSPCIDAGDPSDPVPSGGGRFIDMGWSEFPYIVGDANGDSLVDLGDVLYLIAYLYKNGPPPCPYGAGDVNCDCMIDLGDVLYLIDYLYRGGPAPCGSKEIALSNTMSAFRKLPLLGEVRLLKSELSKDGVAEIQVIGDCDVEVAAVQINLTYDAKRIRVFEPTLTSRTEGFQIYYSNENGQLNIGIVDIKAVHYIPAGEGPIMSLKAEGDDFSSLTIEAIWANEDGKLFQANVTEKLETSPLRPAQYSLSPNYPNPFNPDTKICYTLPEGCHVKLSIYNLKGQRVKVLVDRFEAAGRKRVTWDGTNESGAQVASGVYFYKLEAGDFSSTKKMVLIR